MDYEQIRAHRLADPFRPFNLILDDGRVLPVDKPYYLGISPTKRFVVHSSVGDGFEVIRLEQIRGVSFENVFRPAMPRDGTGAGNGAGGA